MSKVPNSKIPNKEALLEIGQRLNAAGIIWALGGSGLMLYFGCSVEVHDWDITTDAPIGAVEGALRGLTYKRVRPGGVFATDYLFKVQSHSAAVDVMGGFALRTDQGLYKVPTIVTTDWDGIPIGSPGAWVTVYELLGRPEKAQLLRDQLVKDISD